MPWKITFEAPIGTRILRRSMYVTVFGDIWWSYKLKRWVSDEYRRSNRGHYSTHARCRSYKAFLRHLRRHEAILKDHEVILENRFKGHQITAKFEGV